MSHTKPFLFTQYGGMVLFRELKIGDKVRIWTKYCVPIGDKKRVVASHVMVFK